MKADTAQAQLIRCTNCSALNRVPVDKLQQGHDPVCGRCKQPLQIKQTFTVTDATFAQEVENSTLPVLVDLWAPWCGPCRMIAPVLDQLAAEMAGRIRIAKLNVDENPATSSRFHAMHIPLMLLFKGGREVDRIVGAVSKAEIARRLQSVAGS